MTKKTSASMRFAFALAAMSLSPLAMNTALAVPVLFGGDSITVEGGSGDSGNLSEGSTVTVTGPLLQLQLADGSTITVPKGASFRITGEGDSLSIEVISGGIRIDSKGTPITVKRGNTSITTTGGAFSAFASADGGLDGRVNAGEATVVAGGETRIFAKGEGYVATADGVSGTFTPPPATAPQYASNDDTDYSPADDRGTDGNPDIANEATGGGSSGSGGYGGTPPVTGVVVPVTGEESSGYSIVYAADSIGIDQRTDVTVTVGSNGELNRYKVGDGSSEDLERNSNDSLERGNANGEVFIERWAGGETNGNYFNDYNGDTISGLGRTSYQGFHLAYGQVGTNIPTGGTAQYTLAAATSPTFDKGQTAPGTFAGTLGITFGPTFKTGVDFTVTMPGDRTYNILTAGGSANPSAIASVNNLDDGIFTISNISVSQGGIACPTSNCFAIVDGVIGGDAASSIGIAYQILDFGAPVDEYYRSVRLSGAAAFTKGSYDAGGGSGGSGGADPVESGTLSAAFRIPASGTYFGNALFAPILSYQSEATITHDLVVDGEGAFIGFRGTSNGAGTYALNDGVIADLAGTAYMQIGRWNGGPILKNDETYFTTSGWEGMPYLVADRINNSYLPTTGTATYSLFGATQPINSSGAFAPGSFSGSAAVLFGAGGSSGYKIGIDADVTMTETSGVVVYDISTPGGIVDPSQSPINGTIAFYDITSPTGSSVCVSETCQVNIRSALLAGPSGRDLGINYTISQNSGDKIMGSAMFQVVGNDVLLRQDIGMAAIGIGPGSLVITNGFGRQAYSSDGVITYTDPAGGIEAFTSPGSFNDFQAGETTISDQGTSGQLTWSRWTDGAMGGTSYGNPTPTLGEDQSVHVIAGTRATNVPVSGTAQYTLAGATAPTIADGSVAPGTFSGSMGVAFGANSTDSRVGLDLAVTIGGHTYDVVTTGGASTPGTSEIALYGSLFGSAYGHPASITIDAGGPACPASTCKADVSGFLTGSGASHAGIAYAISDTGSPNVGNAVQGVAAFVQTP
ncbi:MAG: hypothetical protein GC184_09250 [Rhizobiales bacterium]|nr:hypothetical protein [Hyphomicrobiales bacterium]